MSTTKRIYFIYFVLFLIIFGSIFLIQEPAHSEYDENPWIWFVSSQPFAWENPYSKWGQDGMVLMGGQGPHLHTLSFATDPDASIKIETLFQVFSENLWPPSWFAERGVNVAGYHNTNGGYEFLIISAHNHRRTDTQYKELLETARALGEKYGMIVVGGSEVFPPHEGVIWNGLYLDDLYPNNFTTVSSDLEDKAEFAKKVSLAETDEYHSISVILHHQAGGSSGRNTLESILAMIDAGSEVMEIYNGCWETGDDLRVNDHNRTGSLNSASSPADGNAESMWDLVLSRGYRVWGAGCDDMHGNRKDIDFTKNSHNWAGNICWIEVLTREGSDAEDIVRAIEAGSFYITQGVQIEEISVKGDTITIIGDDSVDFIEAIGSVGGPVALGPLNQGDGDTGTLVAVSQGNKMVYKSNPFIPYDDLYIRFRLVDTDYDERFYYDEHGDGGGDVYAWTQPFYAKNVLRLIE